MKRDVHFDFAENNVKSVKRRVGTFIRYRCQLTHNFAHSVHFPSKLDILSVYMLDYIDNNYSMRKTFMCGAMKPVSLLFDQPTYNVVSTLAPLFLIESSSFLQVTRTIIKAQMSLNFGQI